MKSRDNSITRRLTAWFHRYHWLVAGGLIVIMFGLAYTSMVGNSAIIDEVAHIPAGYSYLHYNDYRLNPEHPPLIKSLAGIPLQFLKVQFPDNLAPWTTDVNGQWEVGWSFLYHLGNNADQILYWARLPILLLGVGFGIWLYWFTRRRWGVAVGLLTLGFYALSPNILAHTTLVTTDVGATAGIFMALVAFAWFAESPNKKRFWVFSGALTLAQLIKFSAFLLYPFLLLLAVVLVTMLPKPKKWLARLKIYVGGLLGASVLSVVGVWICYIPATWRMPQSVQDALITGSVYDPRFKALAHFLTTINDTSMFKPLVQYLLGVIMVFARVAGGNVTYFNGQVSNNSFKLYFPELFVVKTQVALLVLMLVVVGVTMWRLRHVPVRRWARAVVGHVRGHIVEWTIGLFAVFYFYISVMGNLNLGIRHILPIYLPIFVLVAVGVLRALRRVRPGRWRVSAWAGLAALLVWYGGSTVLAAPGYLSYFNELIGGPGNAYKYFSDSSVDWGQDLLRLRTYVYEHPEIPKIAVDYFGGGQAEYYFCNRKFDDAGHLIATAEGYDCTGSRLVPWHAQYGQYQGQYIAVSETFLENDRWYAEVNHRSGYGYLRDRTPIAKVGNSIFVYKLY